MSEASRGTSGTQVLHRPEVLQTPSLLVQECLFSKPEVVLTAPVRNITLNIHALFLFVAFFPPVLLRLVISSNTDFKARTSKILSDQGSFMWTMETFFYVFPPQMMQKSVCIYWLTDCVVVVVVMGGDKAQVINVT